MIPDARLVIGPVDADFPEKYIAPLPFEKIPLVIAVLVAQGKRFIVNFVKESGERREMIVNKVLVIKKDHVVVLEQDRSGTSVKLKSFKPSKVFCLRIMDESAIVSINDSVNGLSRPSYSSSMMQPPEYKNCTKTD